MSELSVYSLLAVGVVVLGGIAIKLTRFTPAWTPYKTWLLMLPPVFAALWLGLGAWALLVTFLSLYSCKEFARATGLYRERAFVLVVYAAIIGMNLLAFLGEYDHFMTAPMGAIILLILLPVLQNRTEGTLQVFALSVVALVFFAFFLGHLTLLARYWSGLGLVAYIVLATQLNDILAFVFGKVFGRHRWTKLSPNKTIEGSLGALIGAIVLTFLNWQLAFWLLPWWGVLLLGLTIGIGGQIGDLTMANVKRNVGIKDFGNLLPGHGGILDRTNSLIVVAPVALHTLSFFFGGF